MSTHKTFAAVQLPTLPAASLLLPGHMITHKLLGINVFPKIPPQIKERRQIWDAVPTLTAVTVVETLMSNILRLEGRRRIMARARGWGILTRRSLGRGRLEGGSLREGMCTGVLGSPYDEVNKRKTGNSKRQGADIASQSQLVLESNQSLRHKAPGQVPMFADALQVLPSVIVQAYPPQWAKLTSDQLLVCRDSREDDAKKDF
ncbi:hypothetical protein FB45DRAFT_1004398 [Roridomyces roridus]|uniref:Uncharacterized protein n=1 Tax=Roridomyces roridus TaxID=1738132 RepID=A0AAD7FN60_9AGAR|nr:hypothetical protein FB45DRAFT_1004398 [Roridomyces roridus]